MTEFERWCAALSYAANVLTRETASDDDFATALQGLGELSERALKIDLHTYPNIDESTNERVMCFNYDRMQNSSIPLCDNGFHMDIKHQLRLSAEMLFVFLLDELEKSKAEATATSKPQRAEKPLQSSIFTQTDKWKRTMEKAVRMEYLKPYGEGYRRTDKLKSSQLAYILGKLTGYEPNTPTNALCNIGSPFPNADLCRIFGEKRLESANKKVFEAKTVQKWRRDLDEIFDL